MRKNRVTARPFMGEDLRLKQPFSYLVAGSSGSGKSSICIRFLQNVEPICTEHNFGGGIIWCYLKRSAIPSRQFARKKHDRFHEGLLTDFKNVGGKPFLIILHDLLNEAYSKDVSDLFTKGGHHGNISFILITQNLFHQAK